MIDRVIQTALQSGLASIVATPDLIDDVFRQESPEFQDRVKQWVSRKLADVAVNLGFYAGEASAPAITLHIPKMDESVQYVGSEPGSFIGANGNTYPSDGVIDGVYSRDQLSEFQASLEMAVISRNPDEIIWIAELVIYILLRIRAKLELDRGLINQSLTLQDVLIDNQLSTADPVWARAITLRYTIQRTVRVDSTDPDDTLEPDGFTVTLEPT